MLYFHLPLCAPPMVQATGLRCLPGAGYWPGREDCLLWGDSTPLCPPPWAPGLAAAGLGREGLQPHGRQGSHAGREGGAAMQGTRTTELRGALTRAEAGSVGCIGGVSGAA